MILTINKKDALDLNSLVRRVLTFIFEPHILKFDEIIEMQNSLKNWSEKIKLDRIMERSIDEEEYHITRMYQLLKMDEEGEFDDRKKIIKEYGVNWKKQYREVFPESVSLQDIVKANEMKEIYDREHPEQEGLV